MIQSVKVEIQYISQADVAYTRVQRVPLDTDRRMWWKQQDFKIVLAWPSVLNTSWPAVLRGPTQVGPQYYESASAGIYVLSLSLEIDRSAPEG